MTDVESRQQSPSVLKQQRTPSNSGVARSTKKKTTPSKWQDAQKVDVDESKGSIKEDVESQAEGSNVDEETNDGQEEGSEEEEDEGTEVSLYYQKRLPYSMLFQHFYATVRDRRIMSRFFKHVAFFHIAYD